MARPPRIQFCGATYHLMSRGNRKNRIFVDNWDRRAYLDIFAEALDRYEVECPGYCLMGNHCHSVAHTPRGNISSFMKLVNGWFTQYMNRRHKWCGHVFGERFKAIVIDDTDYLRAALAYIARNPVEAGMVADPERWEWSSYGAMMGIRKPQPFLATGWLQRAFPADTVEESRRLFRDKVLSLPELDFDTSDAVLADAKTSAHVRELIATTMYLSEVPREYKALARPNLEKLLGWVTRDQRDQAIRRAHVMYGYTIAEIARCLGVHPTTISRIFARSRRRSE
jgi:putative transposase